MSRRIILTRPAEQSAAWQTALVEAGFSAHSLPLLRIAHLPCPELFFAVGDYSHIFFVSRNALDGLLQWLSLDALLSSPAQFLSPGVGTAQALQALGVSAQRISLPPAQAEQDSEQLWQVLQNSPQAIAPASRVLIVKGLNPDGSNSPNWLAQQATALGAHCDQALVYQRLAPELTVAQAELAQAAAQDGSIWLFSSSQAIAQLAATLPEVDWRQAISLCTHPRIGQAAQNLGFAVHYCLPHADAVVEALRQID